MYNSTTNKCIYTGKGCKEVYKTCELYDEIAQNKNQEDCESIDPPNIIDKSDKDYFSECNFEAFEKKENAKRWISITVEAKLLIKIILHV